MKNTPYIKQYDEEGNLLNPLNGDLKTQKINRRARRKLLKKLSKRYK